MLESMEKCLNAIVMRAVGRISSYKIGDLLMKVFIGNNLVTIENALCYSHLSAYRFQAYV